MAPDYNQAILLEMLELIAAETAADQKIELPRDRALQHAIAWVLHGAVSHFAIRRHIYGASQTVAPDRMIAMQVRAFLAGFSAAVAEARRVEIARLHARHLGLQINRQFKI